MEDTSGAYLYRDDENGIVLIIYMKLSKDKLAKALPLSDIKTEDNYLLASFVNGQDYLGPCTFNHVKNYINKTNAINLLSNNYNEIKKKIKNISLREYTDNLEFAKSQLTD